MSQPLAKGYFVYCTSKNPVPMNYYRKSIRSSRAIRAKAFFFTLAFHAAFVIYFTYGTDASIVEWLPETLRAWLGERTAEGTDVPIP